MFDQFFNFVIYIYPKVVRVKPRGDENMTWFQAFKIAFWGGWTGHVVGRQRREPSNVKPQALVAEEETLPTRDKITPEQPGQGDAEKLDNECKDEDNNVATTSDNLGDVALQTRD